MEARARPVGGRKNNEKVNIHRVRETERLAGAERERERARVAGKEGELDGRRWAPWERGGRAVRARASDT